MKKLNLLAALERRKKNVASKSANTSKDEAIIHRYWQEIKSAEWDAKIGRREIWTALAENKTITCDYERFVAILKKYEADFHEAVNAIE